MSYEIMNEDEEGDQVATSQGWGEFVDWVDHLDDDDFDELYRLTLEGTSNDLAKLTADIREGLVASPPTEDVRDIADGILGFLASHKGSEMVMITNGVTAG